MTTDDFIAKLKAVKRPTRHELFPGATDAALQKWQSESAAKLAPDFQGLLKASNGIMFKVMEHSPQGLFRLYPLEEIKNAAIHMYGGKRDDFPGEWLGIGSDADSTLFVVYDAKKAQYLDVSPIDPESHTVIGKNLKTLLTWLSRNYG